MRDATYALEQSVNTTKRNAISDDLHVVHVVEGKSASASVRRGVLTVTINPKAGPAARPSSLAIARALASAF
jgi:HSP20 family molecular chaperone IbpA